MSRLDIESEISRAREAGEQLNQDAAPGRTKTDFRESEALSHADQEGEGDEDALPAPA